MEVMIATLQVMTGIDSSALAELEDQGDDGSEGEGGRGGRGAKVQVKLRTPKPKVRVKMRSARSTKSILTSSMLRPWGSLRSQHLSLMPHSDLREMASACSGPRSRAPTPARWCGAAARRLIGRRAARQCSSGHRLGVCRGRMNWQAQMRQHGRRRW